MGWDNDAVNLRMRVVDDAAEARALGPLLERAVQAAGIAAGERLGPDTARRIFQRAVGRREGCLLVAEEKTSGRPVALAASTPFEDPLSGDLAPMLVLLYVEPHLRQRGVARSLVLELRRSLASRGMNGLLARAGHNDDALISMGERWGFVRTWEIMSSE